MKLEYIDVNCPCCHNKVFKVETHTKNSHTGVCRECYRTITRLPDGKIKSHFGLPEKTTSGGARFY